MSAMSAINHNLSLFIPHVFPNITKDRMMNAFADASLGTVKRIDFVPKFSRDDKMYYSAYIHFESWSDNIIAANFQQRVLNPEKEARIVYDDPWYWIVLENTSVDKDEEDEEEEEESEDFVAADYVEVIEKALEEARRENALLREENAVLSEQMDDAREFFWSCTDEVGEIPYV